jgi:2'-5' RNA ligase
MGMRPLAPVRCASAQDVTDTAGRPDGRLRLFFALWPGAATAAALHARACALKAECDGRAVRRDTIHLTLAFLGEVPSCDLAALSAIAAGIGGARFTLELDHVGTWRGNRILWTGPSCLPPALVALGQTLADCLRAAGFALEQRAFTPHVTLVRNARRTPQAGETHALHWRVASFVLVASERGTAGAHYRVIGRWRLRENR